MRSSPDRLLQGKREGQLFTFHNSHIETFTFHNAHMETGNASRGQQLSQGGHGRGHVRYTGGKATGSHSYLREATGPSLIIGGRLQGPTAISLFYIQKMQHGQIKAIEMCTWCVCVCVCAVQHSAPLISCCCSGKWLSFEELTRGRLLQGKREGQLFTFHNSHIETFTFHNARMETGNASRGQQQFQGGHGAKFDNWWEGYWV